MIQQLLCINENRDELIAKCVAAEDGVADQTITAYFGEVSLGGRISGATVGGAIYASETVGQYTQTAPSDTGDADTIIGYAIAPDRIVVGIVPEDGVTRQSSVTLE